MRKFCFVKSLKSKKMPVITQMFVLESRMPCSILAHDLFGIEIQIQSHCQFQK